MGFAALLAGLALLLPVAALADSCETCLWEAAAGSGDCCPSSCCPCCLHGPSFPIARGSSLLGLLPVDLASVPEHGRYPTSPARDIFHVPKPSLLQLQVRSA